MIRFIKTCIGIFLFTLIASLFDAKEARANEASCSAYNPWFHVAFADLDGDQVYENIYRHCYTGDVIAEDDAYGDRGLFGGLVGWIASVPLDWELSELGDLDGDGKTDFAWRNRNSGEVAVWLMNGLSVSTWGSLGIVPLDSGWEL